MEKNNISPDEDFNEWDVTLMDGLENEPPYYDLKPNNMKLILMTLFYSLLIFGIFYLLGSFIETTFDIKEWSSESRGVVGVLGGACSIIVGGIYFTSTKLNQEI